MTKAAKSSVTIPIGEKQMIERLRKRLGLKSNVDVVRRGLLILESSLDRAKLRAAYGEASAKVRGVSRDEILELDRLSSEGLED